MKKHITTCDVCGEQFKPSNNYKEILRNGESIDICGSYCASRYWNQLWFESGTISLVTTMAHELKVVKR